jgi:hypothetical protein
LISERCSSVMSSRDDTKTGESISFDSFMKYRTLGQKMTAATVS